MGISVLERSFYRVSSW